MRSAGLILLLLTLSAGGCAAQRATQVLQSPKRITAEQYQPVYQAAIEELRQRGFDVNRKDYRFGVITTHPRGAPTLFEPWIGDNTTLNQATAATLADQRRTVRVTLQPTSGDAAGEPANAEAASDTQAVAEPQAGPETYRVMVEVLLEEKQEPTRRLTGGTGRDIFSTLDEVPYEWKQRGIERNYWRVVGRDPFMEGRLLDALLTRAAAYAPANDPAATPAPDTAPSPPAVSNTP